MRPERILVWVDREDWEHLPGSARALELYGVEFRVCDERLGPYTKLIPASRESADRSLVTSDDDVSYHRTWLEELVSASNANPATIVGHRGAIVTLTSSGRPTAYASWQGIQGPVRGEHVFLTGVGGILYPPGSITELWDQPLLFKELSPRNDDLWFFAMELIHGIPKVAVPSSRRDPIAWMGSQKRALWRSNVTLGENDLQFDRLFDHFDLGQWLRS